jgi:DNA-directed RNA polymerase subunit M/transcription elongation factor TFIIS
MGLKIALGVIICPDCGGVMVYHNYCSTGLYLAECKSCGREWEMRKDIDGRIGEIKPKKIN